MPGVLCTALNKRACAAAGKLFEKHRTKKAYLATVHGYMHPDALASLPHVQRCTAIPPEHLCVLSEALLWLRRGVQPPASRVLPQPAAAVAAWSRPPKVPYHVAGAGGAKRVHLAIEQPADSVTAADGGDAAAVAAADAAGVADAHTAATTAPAASDVPVPRRKKRTQPPPPVADVAAEMSEAEIRAALPVLPFTVTMPLYDNDDSLVIYLSEKHGKVP